MSEQDLTGIGELQALLGQGARFEGKLTFEGRIRIDGHFQGEVFSDGVLILGPTADVTGRLEVGTLIVRGGKLTGEVRAQRLVEVYAPASVSANIVAPQLFLDKGAKFEGTCSLPPEPDGAPRLPAEVPAPG
jgi:cytoskeletal protein CcmA (bactofilin family)